MTSIADTNDLLRACGVTVATDVRQGWAVQTPITGDVIAQIALDDAQVVPGKIKDAHDAFLVWRTTPAPIRGELVRLFGDVLRTHKDALAQMVTIESGKIIAEGRGEVQEMIDICDFAVGLSRQLYGLTMPSERPEHHMREVWHPLGVIGVISAFNFPVAVWAWNAALALICGNTVLWKPSEKTPLTALATHALFEKAVATFRAAGHAAPDNLSHVIIGDAKAGQAMADSPDVPLISATGSTRMGRIVAQRVAERLGRSLLELGGNNAMIVAESADLDMTLRAILFSAVGTAGQRCTTLRRLLLHTSHVDTLLPALIKAYGTLRIGNPLERGVLVGPLIDADAVKSFEKAVSQAVAEGGKILAGGNVLPEKGGFYVAPTIIQMPGQSKIVQHETFAPILYVMTWDTMADAVALQNAVAQGLSSCLFTLNMREAEAFLSASGSDCGIANINIGPSGAEIGGAFGGEKETGGGRESGSDSWKAYMRRQTQTVNYSAALPLAQGVVFES
ncbi:MAG: aldehyde dehydrogenase family protein [Pseudomonadota bacterium]